MSAELHGFCVAASQADTAALHQAVGTLAKGFHDQRYRELIGKLVLRRQELGLTQSEFAARLGHHQQFVSRYELGERRLDVVEFIDVARHLRLTPEALIAAIT